MKKNKKREFQSSELVKSFARIHGFEDKLIAFDIKDFLEDYLDNALFKEIESVNLNEKILEIRIKSPEDYIAMREKISESVLKDFKAESQFWAQYNGQMSNYMGIAFDKFLKLNNQKRGIKSYQNIVIWLWNIHKKELAVAG